MQHTSVKRPVCSNQAEDSQILFCRKGDTLSIPLDRCYYTIDSTFTISRPGLFLDKSGVIVYVPWHSGVIQGDVIGFDKHLKEIIFHYEVNNGVVKKVKKVKTVDGNIQLNENGDCWIGKITTQKERYGWGCHVDDQSHICYEGFCILDLYVGYGTYYYPFRNDSQKKYEGTICNNSFLGKGCLYDEQGLLLFKGVFVDDQPVRDGIVTITNQSSLSSLFCNPIVSIYIDHHCCNNYLNEVNLNIFPNLQSFIVADHCFQECVRLVVVNHSHLHSLVVGESSFTAYTSPKSRKKLKKIVSIVNCSNLSRIEIKEKSFEWMNMFEVSMCSVLTTIELGCNVATNVTQVMFSNLPMLSSFKIAKNAFQFCYQFTLSYLCSLKTLILEDGSVCFQKHTDGSNQCTLSDLSKLTTLIVGKDCFSNANSIRLFNIPLLEEDGIHIHKTLTLLSTIISSDNSNALDRALSKHMHFLVFSNETSLTN